VGDILTGRRLAVQLTRDLYPRIISYIPAGVPDGDSPHSEFAVIRKSVAAIAHHPILVQLAAATMALAVLIQPLGYPGGGGTGG